jgi:carbamoyltransferase
MARRAGEHPRLIWGISALSHDAALAVIRGDSVVFAGHSERYSRIKNDPTLDSRLLANALQYGDPELIAWYERPLLKKLRHLRAGQWAEFTSLEDLPHRYLRSLELPCPLPRITYIDHHDSHAAAGVLTSSFDETAVLVADSIGEFRTVTLGHYSGDQGFQTLHKRGYPHSLGLLYSAFTRRCGFQPNEDEYVLMGLAAAGSPRYVDEIYRDLLTPDGPSFLLKANLHRGIGDWMPRASPEDLAASVQRVTEETILRMARGVQRATRSRRLVFMGGMALNCVANSALASADIFDQISIFPNPGDAGSSVGAAAFALGRPVRWPGPYLGSNIDRAYPVRELLAELSGGGVAGVASGRAEFGPRALGNRSLLADPRPADMKERLNYIKGREPFRPFAPIVRVDRLDEVFALPVPESPYMQFTAVCREPEQYRAVTNVDDSSRVQTVSHDSHPSLYRLLTEWEAATGCPLLLNTSLNFRGEPIIDSAADARRFAAQRDVPVFC